MQRHSSSQRTSLVIKAQPPGLVTCPGAQSLPGGLPGRLAGPLGPEEPLPAPSCSWCIPQAEWPEATAKDAGAHGPLSPGRSCASPEPGRGTRGPPTSGLGQPRAEPDQHFPSRRAPERGWASSAIAPVTSSSESELGARPLLRPRRPWCCRQDVWVALKVTVLACHGPDTSGKDTHGLRGNCGCLPIHMVPTAWSLLTTLQVPRSAFLLPEDPGQLRLLPPKCHPFTWQLSVSGDAGTEAAQAFLQRAQGRQATSWPTWWPPRSTRLSSAANTGGPGPQLHGREGSLLTILPALFGEQGFCSCLGFVLKMNIERRRKQRSEKAGQVSRPTRRTAVKLMNIAPCSPRNLLFSKREVNSPVPCMRAGLCCLQEGRF